MASFIASAVGSGCLFSKSRSWSESSGAPAFRSGYSLRSADAAAISAEAETEAGSSLVTVASGAALDEDKASGITLDLPVALNSDE